MKRCLPATLVLTGLACATTTPTVAAAAVPSENAPAETTVAPVDPGPDAPSIVVKASSPTNVRFQADAHDAVVPLQPIHPPAPSRVRAAVHQGMLIGLGI